MGNETIPATIFDPSYVDVSLQDPILVFPDLPVSNPPPKISVSRLDAQAPFNMYMLLFYTNHELIGGSESVFNKLKSALQQVLVPFFPLSGRLRKDDDTDVIEIECSNQGVLLVEASIKSEEMNFLQDYTLLSSGTLEDKLIYTMDLTKADNPLLSIQVTHFSKGRFSLGIGWRHEIVDGFGMLYFVQAWAAIARGEPLSSIPRLYHWRDSILQPKPDLISSSDWQTTLNERYLGIPNQMFSAQDAETVTYMAKIYVFTKSMISSLKRKAMEGGCLSTCTTFEVVLSHAWVARVKALEMQADDRDVLSFTVNVRSKTDPPLPQHYTGNAFVVTSINCRVGDLVSEPFPAVVQRIQKAKARVEERYIANMLKFLDDEEVRKALIVYGEKSVATDWTQFPLEQVDFGWGSPSFVSAIAQPPLQSLMFLMRTGLEEGGVSLRLGLPLHVMPQFEEYLLLHQLETSG